MAARKAAKAAGARRGKIPAAATAAARAAQARAARLRAQAQQMREMAEMARRRRDYAANKRSLVLAEGLDRQARTAEINQGAEGFKPSVPESSEAERVTPESKVEEESREAAREEGVTERGAEGAVEQPWYKRPTVWIGVVALAALVVIARPKGILRVAVRGSKREGPEPAELPRPAFHVKRLGA